MCEFHASSGSLMFKTSAGHKEPEKGPHASRQFDMPAFDGTLMDTFFPHFKGLKMNVRFHASIQNKNVFHLISSLEYFDSSLGAFETC